MTAAEALAHFAGLSPSNIKMGLDRVLLALDRLGNPQRKFPSLHVAGTNGKGSTCAIAASCLSTRYRTGLYTSPHLIRPNERIQIDGVEIDDATFGKRIAEVIEILTPQHDLTYFEFGTVVAFWHFAQEQVEIAVIETGLGGRLDATTACAPKVTCITPIDFDHQEYLGNTLTSIAREKAGIVKQGVPLISSRQHPDALAVLNDATQNIKLEGRDFGAEKLENGTVRFWSSSGSSSQFEFALKGPHQVQNLAVALACLETLAEANPHPDPLPKGEGAAFASSRFPLSAKELRAGVKDARWPGRLEEFLTEPLVVLDGAHNPAGVQVLLQALDTDFAKRPVHLVFGVFADKDSEPMMRALFPRVQALHLAPIASPRSKDPRSYEALARELNGRVTVHPDAETALATARSQAPHDGLVLVAGSLFLVGQLRRVLLGQPR